MKRGEIKINERDNRNNVFFYFSIFLLFKIVLSCLHVSDEPVTLLYKSKQPNLYTIYITNQIF